MASFKGQKNIDREESFWAKVDKGKDYKCWLWLSKKGTYAW